MTDLRRSGSSSIFSCQNRDPIKLSVHSGTAHRRRQNAVAIGKERRNALMRTKRLRLDGVDCNDDGVLVEGGGMIVDQRNIDLNAQISRAVEGLRSSISFVGQGSAQKISQTLCYLRQILSNSGAPPVEVAIQAGAVPVLGHCLLVCLPDEQLLDAAWCLTNIAAGESEQTKAILPALPMLIANLGEKSSVSVREQCAWALGNAASEECLRNTLVSQGALLPLALMLQSDNSSLARISAWTLCNLIKGSDSNTAMELIMINGVSEAIIKNLKNVEDELSTEVSWIVTYLSALSQNATSILVRNGIIPLLVENLQKSKSLNSIIPILRSLGNCVVGDSYTINGVLLAGQNITNDLISLLVKYMESEHNRFMKKEATRLVFKIAAASFKHKQLMYSCKTTRVLLHLLSTATFDVRKEAAYALGSLCVVTLSEDDRKSIILTDHLVSIVEGGCLSGFIVLVKSPDFEAAKFGLHFLELVLRGMPNGQGPKLVEKEDGIDAIERFQFHKNDDIRNMANYLLDVYFGEAYRGLE